MIEVSKRGRRPLMISLVMAGLATALIGPASAAAGSGPLTTFQFELNENCVHGQGPATEDLKVTLRGPDGAFQGSFVNTTGGDGSWGYDCFWGDINAGDKLIAKVGSITRTFVVPALNFNINRVTDVVSGKTVANSEVQIYLWDCNSNWNCNYITDRVRPTNAKGNFSTDFTNTYNVRGHDQVEVDWYSPQGDNIYREMDAPSVNVDTWYNEFWGDAKPNTDVTAWLFDKMGNQVAKGRDHSDWWDGEYYGKFGRRDILPGYFVGSDIASDALWKVFDINPQFNTAADTINAKCWKNRPYYVYASNIDNGNSFSTTGVTDGNGNISITTTNYNSFDLRSEDTVDIECRNPLGDDQESLFEVP